MTRSAPLAIDWNSGTTALLVIGSTLWLGGPLWGVRLIPSLNGFFDVVHSFHRLFPNLRSQLLRVSRPVRFPLLQFIQTHRLETLLEIVQFPKSAHARSPAQR